MLLVVRDDQIAEPQRAAEDGEEKDDAHPMRIGYAADGPKGNRDERAGQASKRRGARTRVERSSEQVDHSNECPSRPNRGR
jgi:hypothetical protein